MKVLLLFSCALACVGLMAGLMQAICMGLRDSSMWPVVVYACIVLLGCAAVIPLLRRALRLCFNNKGIKHDRRNVIRGY
jgi:hypothetical protein